MPRAKGMEEATRVGDRPGGRSDIIRDKPILTQFHIMFIFT